MGRIILLTVVLVALTVTALGQGNPANETGAGNIIEEVKKAAGELSAAIERRDEATLKLILAHDYIFVHSTGEAEDKTTRINKIVSKKMPMVESSSRDNVQFRVYDKTVIISSDTRQKSELKGVKRELLFRGMMVWVKNQERWHLVAQQSTRVQPVRTAVTLDPKILDLYVGRYELAAPATGSVFVVTREDKSLFGQLANGRKLELTAESESKFFVEGINQQVQFYRDEKGAVTRAGVRIGTGEEMFGKKIQ